MREILFRGKRVDNGEWVEGYYCKMNETTYCSKEDYEKNPVPTHHYIAEERMTDWGLPNKLWCIEVDPATVCQYTGLTDKNGVKIWEHDILMCHGNAKDLIRVVYGEFFVIDAESLETIDKVIGWHYRVIPTDAISRSEPFNIPMPLTGEYIEQLEAEVIRNLFDIPELLKGGAE